MGGVSICNYLRLTSFYVVDEWLGSHSDEAHWTGENSEGRDQEARTQPGEGRSNLKPRVPEKYHLQGNQFNVLKLNTKKLFTIATMHYFVNDSMYIGIKILWNWM